MVTTEALIPIPGMTFGCDPEVFILDEYGAPVSPEDFLPGTKEEPYKVNKGAVQVDGMAGEFIIDPAHTFDEFDDNIVSVMKELTGMLPKGYKLSVVPHMVFPQDVMYKAFQTADRKASVRERGDQY